MKGKIQLPERNTLRGGGKIINSANQKERQAGSGWKTAEEDVKIRRKPGLRKRFVNYVRRKSPWILHMGCGSCNGCAIEIVAAFSPRSDLERFGCLLKGSPRHADVFLVEGPVTRKVKSRLLRIYNQIPEPKVVLGIGACAISQGPFKGCYNVAGPLDRVIPVDVYVPGCPPKPEAIIQGLLQALDKLEERD